jgi:DNA-directed RNA polymerase sigma subunit (sigma70/sigma32)
VAGLLFAARRYDSELDTPFWAYASFWVRKAMQELEIHEVLVLTNALEERERAVIRSHYGLGQKPRTLNEIGAGLGLTAERARQIEAAALAKLRRTLAQPAPVGSTTT